MVPLLLGAASGGPCASEEHARFSSAGGDKGQRSSIVGVATSDRRAFEEHARFSSAGGDRGQGSSIVGVATGGWRASLTLREAWTQRVTVEDYEEHMARIGQAEANAFLLRDLVDGVTGRVLIAGAGTGQMFGYLPADFLAGCQVTSSDVNPAFLARLRERFKCETVVDDIEDSQLTPGFSAIAVVLVLEHVDWQKAIESITRLQPEKLILIVQRNPADVAAAVTPGRLPPGTMRVFAGEAPPHLIPVPELMEKLNGMGFALVRQEARAVQDGKSMIGLAFTRELQSRQR